MSNPSVALSVSDKALRMDVLSDIGLRGDDFIGNRVPAHHHTDNHRFLERSDIVRLGGIFSVAVGYGTGVSSSARASVIDAQRYANRTRTLLLAFGATVTLEEK
jgi:hypothetical protein